MYSSPVVLLSSPAEHAEKEESTGSELTLDLPFWTIPFGPSILDLLLDPQNGSKKGSNIRGQDVDTFLASL